MANKALRILESIKTNAGISAYENMIKSCGTIEEKASPDIQAQYVRAVLNELAHVLQRAGNVCEKETISKVMKTCGHRCISDGTIAKAKAAYKKSENLEDFLRLLNEQHIGGGKLHIKDGKIIGVYEKCYCGLAKGIQDMSPLYCNCSSGWFERLFASVFEKEVEVMKVKTILEGSDKCVFEIKVGQLELPEVINKDVSLIFTNNVGGLQWKIK